MNTLDRSIGAAAGLAWHVMAGADVIVADAPRNWLAAPKPLPQTTAVSSARAPAVAAPARAGAADPAPATGIAAAVGDLAALERALVDYAHPLRQPMPPQLLTGNIEAGIIVLGDQPDSDDAVARLRDRMLAAIGLDTTNTARAHMLPWAAPAGRAPRDAEIAAFAPFLARALALAAPRLVMAFGDKAAGLGAGSTAPARGIASLRGKWLTVEGVPMLATFHPRQLLGQPELKRLAWADLQTFQLRVVAR